MFPVRDDNPQILRPVTTWGIIATTACVWVFVQGLGLEPALSRSVCTLGLIPGELLGTVPAGSSFPLGTGAACVIGAAPQWHTPITSMFMHGGWFHILSNLWFMWIFGDNVEDSMGHVRFALFYVICGLAAAALQVLSSPDSTVPMVGASGAIGGVMGAYIVLFPRVNVHLLIFFGFYVTTVAVPAVAMLGYWFLLQLLGGVGSLGASGGGVAFWAHVGGFVAGAVLSFAFRNPALLRRHPYHGWRAGSPSSRRWHRLR